MKLETLLKQVRVCTHCSEYLPLGANPILQLSASARILIVGQAPGTKVHATGVPFNDASGNKLRQWLNLTKETFYDDRQVAIMPMGFCFPGTGKSGDLPPRKECAALWRDKLHKHLKNIRLTLLIGQYAQACYLGKDTKPTLTETVRSYREYLHLGLFPLVHPSPRNFVWHKRNPWFERDLVPVLQEMVADILED